MQKFLFTPSLEIIGNLAPVASVEKIESETMVYSASPEFAKKNGGTLTRAALDIITPLLEPLKNRYWVVDTRVHMLIPGMYPAIGGWHCDAVPRNDLSSQPDLLKMDSSEHYTVTISTDPSGISNTEFVSEKLELQVDPQAIWASVTSQIGDNVLSEKLSDGQVARFTSNTLHRATVAKRSGWRFFFRCSANYFPAQDKIRKQVQVYTDISKGW